MFKSSRARLVALAIAAACVLVAVPAFAAPSTTVVVEELNTNTRAGDFDTYVVLLNVSDGPVDISGWRFDGCNGGGISGGRATIRAGVELEPGERYLLATRDYDFGAPPDQDFGTSLTPDGGVILYDDEDARVDAVGHSAPECAEGDPALQPAEGDSVTRDDQGTDTDDNAADFTAVASEPQASSGPDLGPVRINELRTNTGSRTKDGFLELRNVSDGPVDVSGWRFVGCSATQQTGERATIPAGTSLDPGEHYLFTNTNFAGDIEGDRSYDTGLATDGGARLFDAQGRLIDGVGHTANQPCTETAPVAVPPADQSVTRDAQGADTNDNSADFTAAEPTPTRSDAPTDPGSGEGPPPEGQAPVSTTVPPGDPAVEQIFEAEELPVVGEPTAKLAGNRPNCCDIVRSNDLAITFGGGGGGPGDYFTQEIDVPADGRYRIATDQTVDPSFGISKLEVDGRQLGDEFNSYNPKVSVEPRVVYGEVGLTAGTHELTWTITGKDPRSSGHRIGFDLVRLTRIPVDPSLALSPPDGAAVRGERAVYGWSTDLAGSVDLLIDDQQVDTQPALGDSASLVFEAEGMQSESIGFANEARVRGQAIPLASDVGEPGGDFATDWVNVPGELLAPGTNTITIAAETVPGRTGANAENRDDFALRNVRLVLADGTVLSDPTKDETIGIGDGCCPNPDSTKPTEVTFAFEVPSGVVEPGRRFDWDTTQVDDGEHTVTVTDGTDERTHTVTVDNTAPAFTATSPTEGEQVKGRFTVDAQLSEEADVTATLDGEEVAVPSELVSDDLGDGEHTLVFTAVDRAGNEVERTVSFTSVAQTPDEPELVAPEDGATGVPAAPELRVRATDPAGDDLDVTFLEATQSDPGDDGTAAAMGTTPIAPPDDLATTTGEGLSEEQRAAASERDGEVVKTEATEGFPYQRYDLRVEGERAETESVEATWEGTTRPNRGVSLLAYDLQAQQWREVDTAVNDDEAPETLTLSGAVDLATMLDGDVVHLLVQGTDPFLDNIDDPADEQFKDPDSFDFSLAYVTDTQYLSEGAVEGRSAFAEAYEDINRWIVDNADERKIAYTAHTGDLINNWIATGANGDTAEYEQRAREEFAFAADTMDILTDAGMPWGTIPGNHDNKFGTTNELYNEYFGPEDLAEVPGYGGSWRPDDAQNHFDLFEAGGQEFIVVYLGFIAGQEEIDWANGVLEAHRDRKAIFATHEYLRPSDNPDGRDGALSDENASSQGEELMEKVVLPNRNVFMTLSGHTHGVALNIKRDVGEQGRTVVEMLANYQFYQVDGERRTGHFRLLQFDVDESTVAVNTYSPTLDDHNANEFDTRDGRYEPEADEFTVPVDLASRDNSVATDAISLDARSDRVIGTDGISPGDEASTRWTGLRPGTEYAWYARATDEFAASAQSDVWSFTTTGEPGGGGPPGGGAGPPSGPPMMAPMPGGPPQVAGDRAGAAPRFPAKLQVARARVRREDRELDVLAPITGRATGEVAADFEAAGRTHEFTQEVDAENRRLRFREGIPGPQARLGTGILTMRYPGNGRTRPQDIRLRAAPNQAEFETDRPVIADGRLRVEGTIVEEARGVVRFRMTWLSGGQEREHTARARIDDGEWEIDEELPEEVVRSLEAMEGEAHSVIAFTGYFPQRIRGEVHTFQVAGG